MGKALGALILLALLTVGLIVYVKLRTPTRPARAEALAHEKAKTDEPLFVAPPFSFVDQHGQPVSNQSLLGKVWVANFIFTTCRTVCPLITTRMVQLQRALSGVDVQFVSFSVDPENDTPEVLGAYARRWAPEESRWTLLATNSSTLPALAAGFRVLAEKSAPGEVDPIIHSAVFVLVDERGMVRRVFSSEHREDLKALESAVRLMRGAKDAAPTAVAPVGVELYHSESCANCHESKELAPPLLGRAGTKVTFETGIVTTFDAEYLKESLLAPDAKRARGFPLKMPSYEHLTPEALQALSRYILETPAQAVPTAEAGVELDPVCQMQVRVTPDALSFEHQGHRFVFCSKHCQRRFAANPNAFVGPGDGGPAL